MIKNINALYMPTLVTLHCGIDRHRQVRFSLIGCWLQFTPVAAYFMNVTDENKLTKTLGVGPVIEAEMDEGRLNLNCF